jgi:hypothetical protein
MEAVTALLVEPVVLLLNKEHEYHVTWKLCCRQIFVNKYNEHKQIKRV